VASTCFPATDLLFVADRHPVSQLCEGPRQPDDMRRAVKDRQTCANTSRIARSSGVTPSIGRTGY
jgi:hypothetical protein